MKQIKHMILLCLFCLTGIAAQAQTGPANNTIWYTAAAKLTEVSGTGSTAGLHYEAFTDADGKTLTMKSHTWEEATGKGVITFDGSIATVGYRAFYREAVTSVTLPECVTTIGKYAFGSCSKVTSINFPEGLQSIGDNAFATCKTLTSIKLAEGLESIGTYAFDKTGLTSVDIPKSVTTIGRYAFNCDNLSTLKVHWPEGPDASTDMSTAFKTNVKSAEFWFPAGSWKQNATFSFGPSPSLIHYLTFRQDPHTKTDYYATFYTNLEIARDKYCYDLTLTDIKAYTGVLEPTDDPDVDALKLKEAGNIIGNGIAVVLKYTAGDDLGPTIDIAIPTTSEMPQAVEKNDLTGTDINLSWNGEGERLIPANTYALSSSKEYGVGFYYSNYEGWTIDAHKAFLTLGSSVAKSIIFQFEDEPTGIESLTPALSEGDGAIYNLNGMRVNDSYKGIVIKNGKKFYQK